MTNGFLKSAPPASGLPILGTLQSGLEFGSHQSVGISAIGVCPHSAGDSNGAFGPGYGHFFERC